MKPVTGPVARFARQIAGHGYIVAAPSSYHEFTGPEPLAYDGPGTDEGNRYKITKVCCFLSLFLEFVVGWGRGGLVAGGKEDWGGNRS